MVAAMLTAASGIIAGCEPSRDSAVPNARVVTVWAHHGQARENAAMRAIFEAFNQAHEGEGLQVKVEYYPDQSFADKVSIASASDTLPDIVEVDGPLVGPWAAEGLLRPLDDFVRPEMRADFLDSVLTQGTYDGCLYALGAFDSALVVYYNQDIIEAAGVHPPSTVENAWTWSEFTTALRQVKPHVALPLSLHMDTPSAEWMTYAFAPLIWSNGGALIDASGRRTLGVMNGPRAVEATGRWQDLFESGLAEATTTRPNPFSASLAAFDWTGHWMLSTFEKTEGLRFGVMPLPRMGEHPVAPSGSWCWAISRSCDHPEDAWRVMTWLLDPEHGIAPMVKANDAAPARHSAVKILPAYQRMPRKLFVDQLTAAGRARPRTPVYLVLTKSFSAALHDIALGVDVEVRLTEAAENVQRALDRRARRNSHSPEGDAP